MSGRERGAIVAQGGIEGVGLEIGGESLFLHSLFSGGGLEGGGVLLRSSSKLGEIRPRPFDVWMLFVFKCCKLLKLYITICALHVYMNTMAQ